MNIKPRAYVALLVAIVLIFLFSSMQREVILQKEEIDEANFTYSPTRQGFDLTKGKLTFGMISPGGSASRSILVENNFDQTVLVNIRSIGSISDNLAVSINNFLLQPNELREVTFSVYPPKDNQFGPYTGTVTITMK